MSIYVHSGGVMTFLENGCLELYLKLEFFCPFLFKPLLYIKLFLQLLIIGHSLYITQQYNTILIIGRLLFLGHTIT